MDEAGEAKVVAAAAVDADDDSELVVDGGECDWDD